MANPMERWHPASNEVKKPIRASNMNKKSKRNKSGHSGANWLKKTLIFLAISLLMGGLLWMVIEKEQLKKEAAFPNKMVELHEMLNPVYTGQDEHGKPYIIKATKGKLLNPDDEDSLLHIDLPWGEFVGNDNVTVQLSAAQGLYDTKARILTLNDNVRFVTSDGYDFTTPAAIIYMKEARAEGDKPVKGKGPQGVIRAEGFRIGEKGAIVSFIGNSQALLKESAPRKD